MKVDILVSKENPILNERKNLRHNNNSDFFPTENIQEHKMILTLKI